MLGSLEPQGRLGHHSRLAKLVPVVRHHALQDLDADDRGGQVVNDRAWGRGHDWHTSPKFGRVEDRILFGFFGVEPRDQPQATERKSIPRLHTGNLN